MRVVVCRPTQFEARIGQASGESAHAAEQASECRPMVHSRILSAGTTFGGVRPAAEENLRFPLSCTHSLAPHLGDGIFYAVLA